MFDIDKSIKQIIGNKKIGGKNDWDFDGVTNKKDCQPRNTMRQEGFIGRIISQVKRKKEEAEYWERFSRLKRFDQMKAFAITDIEISRRKLEHTEDETERRKLINSIKDKVEIYNVMSKSEAR